MEDTLFECRYEYNDDLDKECQKFYHFRMPARIVGFVICFLFVGALAGFSIYFTVYDAPEKTFYWILTIALAAFYLFLIFNGYRRALYTNRKRRVELYGSSSAVCEYFVTDKELKFNNLANHQEITVSLYTIVKMYETKNLIILKSSGNLLHIFTKSGFTKGTPDEFVKFMRSRYCK